MREASVLLFATACASSGALRTTECGSVGWGPRPGPASWVSVEGASTVELRVAGAAGPVAGATTQGDQRAVFWPAFPLVSGLRYVVRSDSGCEVSVVVAPFEAPAAPARVAEIYPTADVLPENILRFYVYFSQAMAEGDFLRYVKLTHVESGRDLSGVFFDNMYELWSRDRKRITLLVDPGRVKTGLAAHLRRGRAFAAGQTYALTILSGWPSLDGRSLGRERTKIFRVAPADLHPVDPFAWKLDGPMGGSRSPLRVRFPKPMDHVSVARFLAVTSPEGLRLGGRWQMKQAEREALWTPASPWRGSVREHVLVVEGRFEDVAGNNVNAAFEHAPGALPPEGESRTVKVPLR